MPSSRTIDSETAKCHLLSWPELGGYRLAHNAGRRSGWLPVVGGAARRALRPATRRVTAVAAVGGREDRRVLWSSRWIATQSPMNRARPTTVRARPRITMALNISDRLPCAAGGAGGRDRRDG